MDQKCSGKNKKEIGPVKKYILGWGWGVWNFTQNVQMITIFVITVGGAHRIPYTVKAAWCDDHFGTDE